MNDRKLTTISKMPLRIEPWSTQQARWPTSGAHVLAQFDDETIVVYQAYRPEIGLWAIEHQRLDGPAFSLSRMSWIKPNFLWLMHRSGWGTKPGQEVVLALRVRRIAFDGWLRSAVPSSFRAAGDLSEADWRQAVADSEVRLQWDPDHAPDGSRQQRRAVQLGLRGTALRALTHETLVEVIDVSAFVADQRERIGCEDLHTPTEQVYVPSAC